MHRSKESRFAVAVGCATTAVAALTLLGVDFGINVSLAPQGAVLEPGPASSRMMVEMPFSTAPIGAALALSRFEKYHFAAILLAGLGGVMAAFGLLIYVAGIPVFFGAGPDTTAAVPRWPSLRRHRDYLADRNDGGAPEAATPAVKLCRVHRHNRRVTDQNPPISRQKLASTSIP